MEKKIRLLKALGDPSRMRIVQLLLCGEQCACSFVPYLRKSQPTVSRHLGILEKAGVVESRRDGTNIWYRLNSRDAVRVMSVLGIDRIKAKAKC